jgi:alkanesulfonate monooxygenase
LVLGGAARRKGAALAARYADEYNVAFQPVEETSAVFDRVRAAAAETGRGLVYSAAQVVCLATDDAGMQRRADAIGREPAELRENGVAGTVAQARERLARYADLGASRIYLQVLDMSDLEHLELIAELL